MNPVTDLSQLTNGALQELFQKAPQIPQGDLAKAGITTATGLTYYDLQAPSL